jgi:hypothetical protein
LLTGSTAELAEPDRLLTPQQAALILGVTPSWLKDHYRRFSFHRKLSRKVIHYSEQGLRRWLAAKRA